MRSSRLGPARRTGLIAVSLGALLATAIASAAGGTAVGTHSTYRGKVLANSRGFSLYMFAKDRKGGKSTCNGQCAVVWPPLLTSGRPVAVKGVKQKLLGTTRRSNGKLEVTYNGYPLYLYAPDTKPGDANGEGFVQFGAAWYLLNTRGQPVKCPPNEKATTGGCVPGMY
jgi:predicted lipoprotein with Yx(FWY)xxD motif